MNIEVDFGDLDKQFNKEADRLKKNAKMNMQRIGEVYLKTARKTGNYKDQTGNLRSSTGYGIVEDGVITEQTIYEHSKGTDRKNGVNEGRQFLEDISHKSNVDMEVILSAGMNYASHVEGKGYDVATSGILAAEKEARKLFK